MSWGPPEALIDGRWRAWLGCVILGLSRWHPSCAPGQSAGIHFLCLPRCLHSLPNCALVRGSLVSYSMVTHRHPAHHHLLPMVRDGGTDVRKHRYLHLVLLTPQPIKSPLILVYRTVISIDRWPSHSCIVLRSMPLSARA